MRYCTKCENQVAAPRYELGFRECIDCSSEEKKRALDIIVHKTGNSLQHIHADDFKDHEKRFLRGGFRSNLASIKGGGHKEFSGKLTNSGASIAQVGSPELYAKIGEESILYLESEGLSKALDYLDKQYNKVRINAGQLRKLRNVVSAYANIIS